MGIVSLEMGHVRIPHDSVLDPFKGVCPFHTDCFEGLASGPAIQKRFGKRAETILDSDPYWDIEAGYIAFALANYILTLAPKKIILGGGVMQKEFLFGKIRRKVSEILNGYLNHKTLLGNLEDYIVPPGLGNRSGMLGAIALAIEFSA
jgi:fructokinase